MLASTFLHFSVFLFGGLSSHSNFSTSAAICAMGERGGNRNRVTGQEYWNLLNQVGSRFDFCTCAGNKSLTNRDKMYESHKKYDVDQEMKITKRLARWNDTKAINKTLAT